ncbi:hypothetical protein HMPREF1547_02661 [Blautia sp. KLE 1732]|nr:hypothetical protein HMPREF1547_02661 [Blautia sp. KLE 1732]
MKREDTVVVLQKYVRWNICLICRQQQIKCAHKRAQNGGRYD